MIAPINNYLESIFFINVNADWKGLDSLRFNEIIILAFDDDLFCLLQSICDANKYKK